MRALAKSIELRANPPALDGLPDYWVVSGELLSRTHHGLHRVDYPDEKRACTPSLFLETTNSPDSLKFEPQDILSED
jgi:hypothetical protein